MREPFNIAWGTPVAALTYIYLNNFNPCIDY